MTEERHAVRQGVQLPIITADCTVTGWSERQIATVEVEAGVTEGPRAAVRDRVRTAVGSDAVLWVIDASRFLRLSRRHAANFSQEVVACNLLFIFPS
jgi:hypothetical protein